MSMWATEVMRCALRLCSRRSLWQQRSFLLTSTKDTCFPCQRLSHACGPQQSQTWLCRRVVSSVRYYSQDKNPTDGLKESDHLTSPLAELSLSPESQLDATASDQSQILTLASFVEHLDRCNSPSDVLDFTCQYPLTVQQVSGCLDRIWLITKKLSDEQLRYEQQLMFDHPAFEKLLRTAMNSVRSMRNVSMAYSLLSMVSLGVPQQSRVIQTFLQVCQERLGDFDDKSLSILCNCLENMENSPSVYTLKEGMKLIVQSRLPKINNVMALQVIMRVLGKDTPKKLKWKLERKALSLSDQFSLPNCLYMFFSMASMGFYSKPLLDVCSLKITENLHEIPFSKYHKLLRSCKDLVYRDLYLLTSISDHVASTPDIWTNQQLILFLSLFENLAFCPAGLMEAYAEKVIAKPNILTLQSLLFVLKLYSTFNYDLQHRRQQFLDSLTHVLDSYLPKMSVIQLLKAVYFLCIMGHFPSAPLEKLLQASTLEQIESSTLNKVTEKMFQVVDLCLRLDRPPLPQPLTVPAAVLGQPAAYGSQSVNQRLLEDLQNMLKDQAQTVLEEMVVVENFYIIDGVVTKPLPNRTSVTEASSCAGDESSPAESSQKLAVIYVPLSAFCYGTSNPRGSLALKIRHLKILGYTPVLVTEQELQCVSEEGRMDILKGLIFPEHHRSETQPQVEQPESWRISQQKWKQRVEQARPTS